MYILNTLINNICRGEKMKVKDIMTKDVISVSKFDSIVSAAKKMKDYDIGMVVVVDDKNEVLGVLTDRDIVIRAVYKNNIEGFVDDVMTPNPACIEPEEDVKKAITDKTILISIMFANNEIGTIQPVKEIGRIAREHGVYFHTDAVQAVGHVPIDVKDMNIDLLSLSAHKFYGPKGVGALYVRKGVRIHPYLHGGAQERNRRAGTENLPGIVGLGKAIELAYENLEESNSKLAAMRDRLIAGIMENIDHVRLNGHTVKRLPGNANLSFEFIEGEALLLSLDMKGIAASSGSACTSGSLDPSHVLLAIGLTHEIAHGSLRLTLGDDNTDEDVDYVLEVLPGIVERLRNMSPLFAQHKGEKYYV